MNHFLSGIKIFVELVRELKETGAFQVKGAVDHVALLEVHYLQLSQEDSIATGSQPDLIFLFTITPTEVCSC
jgi:hypothetical protein